MRSNGAKWFTLCLLCIIPFTASAVKYGVLHLKPVGVSYATTETVASLLVSDLTNYGHTVLNPDAMDAAVGDVLECYENECAAEAGAQAAVERVIYGSVSTLGEKYIVQVSVVNVMTKEILWAGSLAAKTAEDLDTVVKRLAKSISEGKKAEETVEVGLVIEEEEKEPLRRRVYHTTGFKAGMILPMGGYADAGLMYQVGAQYWYEMPNFAIEAAVYYAHTSSLGFDLEGTASEAVAPEISVLYMLSKGDISPYIGGGFGLGLIWLTPEEEWDLGAGIGPAFNAGGGLVLFRTYDIRITIDARYRVNFAQVTGFQAQDTRFEGPHHGFTFSIGLSYRPKPRNGGGCCGCLNIW